MCVWGGKLYYLYYINYIYTRVPKPYIQLLTRHLHGDALLVSQT